MTTRRNQSDQYREAIGPYLEDWAERDFAFWEQFRNWSVQQVLWDYNLSMEEVEDVTRVDGRSDQGIDGWYEDNSNTPARLILVQSKDTQIATDDFSKMKDGLTKLLVPNHPANANRALLEKSTQFLRNLPVEFEVDCYLTSSRVAQQGLEPLSSGEPWRVEQLYLPDLERTVTVNSYVRDIRFLVNNLQVMHENPIPATFLVDKSSYFQINVGGHYRTVTAALKGEDLASVYNQNKQNLFRKNPRYYLGITGQKNRDVMKTLLESGREDFFIYNNGITCVARSIRVDEVLDNPNLVRLSLVDFQIVNGCQTTATIADASLKEDISRVQVLAKIVETPLAGGGQSDAMSDLIAERSNTQNPLKAEDWKSNDSRQMRWHDQFSKTLPEPWFYEIKRGTWTTSFADSSSKRPFKIRDTTKYRKVTMKDLGQECWAFLGSPAEAKDKAREIFNVKATYDLVFNETLTASQLFLPHLIYVAAEAKRKQIPEYQLPSNDALHGQHGEARVATEHLRHPIVAAIGQVFASLRGLPHSTYLSHSQSEELIRNESEWLDILVDRAFLGLARRLLLESARSGVGPRSIVRTNDWMQDAIENLTETTRVQVRIEHQMGAGPGTLANTLRCLISP